MFRQPENQQDFRDCWHFLTNVLYRNNSECSIYSKKDVKDDRALLIGVWYPPANHFFELRERPIVLSHSRRAFKDVISIHVQPRIIRYTLWTHQSLREFSASRLDSSLKKVFGPIFVSLWVILLIMITNNEEQSKHLRYVVISTVI